MRGCCAPGVPVDIGPPLRWAFPGAANSSVVWAAPRSLPPLPSCARTGLCEKKGVSRWRSREGRPRRVGAFPALHHLPSPLRAHMGLGTPPTVVASPAPRTQVRPWGGGGGGKQVPWGSPATPPRRLPVVICSSLKCNQENSLATPAAVQRGSADWRVPPSFGLRLNLETETELYSNICHYN